MMPPKQTPYLNDRYDDMRAQFRLERERRDRRDRAIYYVCVSFTVGVLLWGWLS